MTAPMTDPTTSPPRRLACARCGAGFDCGLSGDCWCAAVPYRLPMTDAAAAAAEDCLCPHCLRRAADPARPQRPGL